MFMVFRHALKTLSGFLLPVLGPPDERQFVNCSELAAQNVTTVLVKFLSSL